MTQAGFPQARRGTGVVNFQSSFEVFVGAALCCPSSVGCRSPIPMADVGCSPPRAAVVPPLPPGASLDGAQPRALVLS